MTDFAELVLTADTTGLVRGEAALDSLVTTGNRTQLAVVRQSDAMSGSFTKFGSAAKSAAGQTAIFDSATKGLTFKDQAADLAAAAQEAANYGAQMDAIRARFNPIFAASKQYEAQLSEIAQTERMGAISAMEAAAARERAAQSLGVANTQMATYGTVTRASGFHTANLAAQFNDIGVMLAAGQSPLMLAVQQGAQINQVFAQMRATGQSVFSGLAAGITSMINPMSLATIGIIAGGAALTQWAIGALTASDNTDDLADAMERLEESTRDANLELERIRGGYDNTEQANAARLIDVERVAIAELTEQLRVYQQILAQDPNSNAPQQIASIQAQIAAREAEIARIQEQIRENRGLNRELETAKNKATEIADAARAIADNIALSLPHMNTLVARMSRVANEAWRAALGAAEMRAASESRTLDQRAEDARAYGAGQQAMRAAVEAQRFSTNGRFPGIPDPFDTGGGGGASPVDERMQRAAQIFDRTRTAAEAYADELRDLNELRDMGYLSEETHARAVAQLGDELTGATRRAEGLRNATSQTFADIVTGAQSAGDAISGLLANLAGMFANAAFGGLFQSVGLFDVFGGLLSFDGGGYTGAGARSGGVDGKGGFPAILHPNETVVDHTRGNGAISGGGSVHVTVSVGRDGSIMPVIEQVSGRVAASVSRSAIEQYDRSILPQSMRRVQGDPRRIG